MLYQLRNSAHNALSSAFDFLGDAVSPLVILGTPGAGLGLSVGAAFNLRLHQALQVPTATSLVNFVGGVLLLLVLWTLGVDGRTLPGALPPLWTFLGGFLGATYVILNVIGAARFGIGVSTVAVTLGQILSALLINAQGWFGQAARAPPWRAWVSALLLLVAVSLLA